MSPDDQKLRPGNAFPHAGPLRRVFWPTPTAPRYMLVFGALPRPGHPPTWGLATIDEDEVYETIYARPAAVTPADLFAWLEPQTHQDAARALVATMATHCPELFVHA